MKKNILSLVYLSSAFFLGSFNQQAAQGNSAQVRGLDDKVQQVADQENQPQTDADDQEPVSDENSSPQGDSYDVFYDGLKSEGHWYNDDTYGYVFQPAVAERDEWRPYTDGRWAHTDQGYTWVSNEKFGWATYHYGRWVRLEGNGWVWVPGRKWAPAWVSWRQSDQDDYVGWAPLPPECDDDQPEKVAVEAWSDNYYGVGPAAYIFLRGADFGRTNYREVILPPQQNITILTQTKNITNITYQNNVINNYGPQFDQLNRVNNNQLQHYQINYQIQKTSTASFATALSGNEIRIVAPPAQLRNMARIAPPIARQIQNAPVERGWQNIDAAKTQELKQAIRSQAPPPPKALPAQPVTPPKTAIGAASPRQAQPNQQPPKSQVANPGQTAVKAGAAPTAALPPKPAAQPAVQQETATAAEKHQAEIEKQKQTEAPKAAATRPPQEQPAKAPPATQQKPAEAPKAAATRPQQEEPAKAPPATQEQRAEAPKATATRPPQEQPAKAPPATPQKPAEAPKAAATRPQQEQPAKAPPAAQEQPAEASKAAAARQKQEGAQHPQQQAQNPQPEQGQRAAEEKKRQEEHKNGEKHPAPTPAP